MSAVQRNFSGELEPLIYWDASYNEMAFFLIKNALAVEGRRLRKTWQQVYEDHPEFVTTIMPNVRGKTAEIEVATLQLPITEQVRERAFALMETYKKQARRLPHSCVEMNR
ncbi:MAG: hypothetical protein ACE5NG_16590, partial [bacterium]